MPRMFSLSGRLRLPMASMAGSTMAASCLVGLRRMSFISARRSSANLPFATSTPSAACCASTSPRLSMLFSMASTDGRPATSPGARRTGSTMVPPVRSRAVSSRGVGRACTAANGAAAMKP